MSTLWMKSTDESSLLEAMEKGSKGCGLAVICPNLLCCIGHSTSTMLAVTLLSSRAELCTITPFSHAQTAAWS